MYKPLARWREWQRSRRRALAGTAVGGISITLLHLATTIAVEIELAVLVNRRRRRAGKNRQRYTSRKRLQRATPRKTAFNIVSPHNVAAHVRDEVFETRITAVRPVRMPHHHTARVDTKTTVRVVWVTEHSLSLIS